MSTGSGSYQKMGDMSMNNMWKKIGAFIRNVHMLFTKLPDYRPPGPNILADLVLLRGFGPGTFYSFSEVIQSLNGGYTQQ